LDNTAINHVLLLEKIKENPQGENSYPCRDVFSRQGWMRKNRAVWKIAANASRRRTRSHATWKMNCVFLDGYFGLLADFNRLGRRSTIDICFDDYFLKFIRCQAINGH
jgi:hypothetical protein